MAFPFSAMPTLGQFVTRAVEQGCSVKEVLGMVGQEGDIKARYLIGLGRNPAIAVLPNIKDDERLSPALIANLVRVLKVSGFEHCYAEEMKALERWLPSEDEET